MSELILLINFVETLYFLHAIKSFLILYILLN